MVEYINRMLGGLMDSKERRIVIEDMLRKSSSSQRGHIIAQKLGVTRQVIVKDIAILRAEGKNIIATPDGYIMIDNKYNKFKKVIAVSHSADKIEDELMSIVKFGGVIQDVIVEHPLYGEIRGMLMLKSSYDIESFMKKIKQNNAEPLLVLTGGVHLHTILSEDETSMDKIIMELKNKGYLISE